MTIRFARRAAREVERIDAWWKTNRSAAPELFREELAGAVALLEVAPDLGRLYGPRASSHVRRILLPRTRYHVYYTHDRALGVVEIVSVWSGVRRAGPKLQ